MSRVLTFIWNLNQDLFVSFPGGHPLSYYTFVVALYQKILFTKHHSLYMNLSWFDINIFCAHFMRGYAPPLSNYAV